MYLRMGIATAVLCIGGPLIVYSVIPNEDELFKRYSPALQREVLATRDQRRKDYEEFLERLRGIAKDPRPLWEIEKEEVERVRKLKLNYPNRNLNPTPNRNLRGDWDRENINGNSDNSGSNSGSTR